MKEEQREGALPADPSAEAPPVARDARNPGESRRRKRGRSKSNRRPAAGGGTPRAKTGGASDYPRDRQAEGLGGLEVDDQFEPGRLQQLAARPERSSS